MVTVQWSAASQARVAALPKEVRKVSGGSFEDVEGRFGPRAESSRVIRRKQVCTKRRA